MENKLKNLNSDISYLSGRSCRFGMENEITPAPPNAPIKSANRRSSRNISLKEEEDVEDSTYNGRCVRKSFNGKLYNGTIKESFKDDKTGIIQYHVVFDDGDKGDYDISEIDEDIIEYDNIYHELKIKTIF